MIKDILSFIGIIDYCTKHKMDRVPHGWYNEKSHCPKCYEEIAPFRHAIKSVKKAKFSPFKRNKRKGGL